MLCRPWKSDSVGWFSGTMVVVGGRDFEELRVCCAMIPGEMAFAYCDGSVWWCFVHMTSGSCSNVCEDCSADTITRGYLVSLLQVAKAVLSGARAGSLVLMDEMGSGTDPMQGAALAQSLLEVWKKKRKNAVPVELAQK